MGPLNLAPTLIWRLDSTQLFDTRREQVLESRHEIGYTYATDSQISTIREAAMPFQRTWSCSCCVHESFANRLRAHRVISNNSEGSVYMKKINTKKAGPLLSWFWWATTIIIKSETIMIISGTVLSEQIKWPLDKHRQVKIIQFNIHRNRLQPCWGSMSEGFWGYTQHMRQSKGICEKLNQGVVCFTFRISPSGPW